MPQRLFILTWLLVNILKSSEFENLLTVNHTELHRNACEASRSCQVFRKSVVDAVRQEDEAEITINQLLLIHSWI